ncbi:TM2 domain-containing protein [Sediminibacter sp. Hel_I_10]|uniref:TM2 domain-containing protein n=1 Tax=Sediminibacter sp. Hel_I_10 TaxID=1392490 RepID=UPI001E3A5C3D|nr:TM2 domain-containing protein [Sediminibacter sp. Hel_I_10]
MKRTAATVIENVEASQSSDINVASGEFYSPAAKAGDDKWVAVALLVFLWPFAAHRWYLGFS